MKRTCHRRGQSAQATALRALVAFAMLLAAAPSFAQAQAQGQLATAPPRAAGRPPPLPAKAPVILISIDGFRADYPTRGYTPTLLRLARAGAWASRGMRPSFPSLTFPNHYTLVTGLRPDRNGMVGNSFDDPAIGKGHFAYSNYDVAADPRWWNEATPIWLSAQKAGLRTGTLFWPGSEAEIQGVRPTYFAHFDAVMAPNTRVDMLLDWLDLPLDRRPTLFTLYFDRVDHWGHLSGPDSRDVNLALRETDRAIARLLAGLKRRGLAGSANLVITADHGMTATSKERLVYWEDWIPPDQVKEVFAGPVAAFAPKPGAQAAAVEAAILKPHDHVQCWRKADIPARLHYGSNPRVAPLICMAEAGWEITTRDYVARHDHFSTGEHGYDPETPDMAALFIASGPAFRRGYRQPVFDNTAVRPLLEALLGLPVTPADGNFDTAAMLRLPPPAQ